MNKFHLPIKLFLIFSFVFIAHVRAASASSCVLIDNDYDIDDMMAIPLVIGNKYVAAIIQSEGYTIPEEGAAAVNALVNQLPDQPSQRKIPIIVGGKQGTSGRQDLKAWPWLPFFRSMMNLSNGLVSSVPKPFPSDPDYVKKVASAVQGCKEVSVLIIGTYTSFINYSPLIKHKIKDVIVMGQAIDDESRTSGKESFNCRYDFSACKEAMTQLQGIKTYFVDIPRIANCDTKTPSDECYSSSYEMVAGINGSGGLAPSGLPNRLKSALINKIDCSKFYVPLSNKPCSSLSTWVPANVISGPGGEMLLWDQTAALFLLAPEIFSLYYPPENRSIGGKHYEPTVINGDHTKTVKRLRELWTNFSNASVNYIDR